MRMKVTFSDEEQAAIDVLRGGLPAATWVRQLVRQAALAAHLLADPVAQAVDTLARHPGPLAEAPTEVRVEAGSAIPGVVRASELSGAWPPPEPLP